MRKRMRRRLNPKKKNQRPTKESVWLRVEAAGQQGPRWQSNSCVKDGALGGEGETHHSSEQGCRTDLCR
ncbi:hypothetical protein NDU88_002064 [Pleurodeles waltl]|uniref:Uncharacterized protein n=1 Tax=Pleurodeles waltl TaxID=8319 RepID=A0AAV7MNA4_PLEWA|nr:hypothetical protein NDU88_002064 [Pleurodeles waltl]